jgi:hypothetical protein
MDNSMLDKSLVCRWCGDTFTHPPAFANHTKDCRTLSPASRRAKALQRQQRQKKDLGQKKNAVGKGLLAFAESRRAMKMNVALSLSKVARKEGSRRAEEARRGTEREEEKEKRREKEREEKRREKEREEERRGEKEREEEREEERRI